MKVQLLLKDKFQCFGCKPLFNTCWRSLYNLFLFLCHNFSNSLCLTIGSIFICCKSQQNYYIEKLWLWKIRIKYILLIIVNLAIILSIAYVSEKELDRGKIKTKSYFFFFFSFLQEK